MISVLASRVFPYSPRNLVYNSGFKGWIKCDLSGEESETDSSSSVSVNASKNGSQIGGKYEDLCGTVEVKPSRRLGRIDLPVLWDDGYGTASLKDYIDGSKQMIKSDGGPPRWFCPVECGCPLDGSPLLFYLPGMDGVGLGLTLHHKSLGKVFELRCLHIPIYDRTPFRGLVDFIEKTLREEHALSPNKPIYLVGESFGGCLALAVASRCPTIDLVLILANPATSMNRSQLSPVIPIMEALPQNLHKFLPYALTTTVGNPLKLAKANIDPMLSFSPMVEKVIENLFVAFSSLSVAAEILPKDTFLWKFQLLRSGANYTNARLHAVTAEVLVLASGKDNMLPSKDEAKRLSKELKNCDFRTFWSNGHTLLLENGINLLTVIKATHKYRRSRKLDIVLDFIPPSLHEYKVEFPRLAGLIRHFTSPVFFSTLEDGKIVRGLTGVPDEGPVLLVGYHMLIGLELGGLCDGFLKEKKLMVRGLAHPELYELHYTNEVSYSDLTRIFGATPVTAENFFRLLSTKSHILLYPGGAREALHLKGEEYKVIWPERQEFVRMAAKFGATIVPFGAVGEDDLVKLVLDYNDYMRIPGVNYILQQLTSQMTKVRNGTEGFDAENLYLPGVIPKLLPGRFYYLFGKPIKTQGKRELVNDKESAQQLYREIKSEVEGAMAYLLKKREEDPYRSHIDRSIYGFFSQGQLEIPAFTP